MKKINNLVFKWGSAIASLALVVSVASIDTACYWWFNQPKVPEGLEAFKKNK